MSKFASDTLAVIDCGDDEWVKIPDVLSVADMEKFTEISNTDQPTVAFSVKAMVYFIREWNFKDKDGKVPEITEANLKRLDMKVFSLIMNGLKDRITLSKKKLPKSEESSEDTAAQS